MLKITTVKTDRRCRLVLEGGGARLTLGGRTQKGVERRSRLSGGPEANCGSEKCDDDQSEGKDVLLDMMRKGVGFVCGGVLNRHILQQLARKSTL